MKNFFKKLKKFCSLEFQGINKIWLALFLPLTIAGFISSGATFLWCLSTGLGAIYIIWQLLTPKVER